MQSQEPVRRLDKVRTRKAIVAKMIRKIVRMGFQSYPQLEYMDSAVMSGGHRSYPDANVSES